MILVQPGLNTKSGKLLATRILIGRCTVATALVALAPVQDLVSLDQSMTVTGTVSVT